MLPRIGSATKKGEKYGEGLLDRTRDITDQERYKLYMAANAGPFKK